MHAGRGKRVPTLAGHVQAHAQSRALIDRLRFEIWDTGSRTWHEIDRSIVNVPRFGLVLLLITVNVEKHVDLSKEILHECAKAPIWWTLSKSEMIVPKQVWDG